MQTLLWLAAADARGHLVRAALARRVLAPLGVRVDIVTTSRAGADFLAAWDIDAAVLPGGWAVPFVGQQDLDRPAARRAVLRWLVQGAGRDAKALARLPGDVLVNDLHPLPLVRPDRPVIHLAGRTLWAEVRAQAGAFPLDALRARGHGRIEHAADIDDAGLSGPNAWRLPSLLPALPGPATEATGPRVAVYLNPHFREPALAAAVEGAFRGGRWAGATLHAVGEGYAGRPGWRAVDPDFVAAAATADVLVSAPGMGAVSIARRFGVPMVALVTDQPEQRRNLAMLAGLPHVVVRLDRAAPIDLAAALVHLPPNRARPDPALVVTRIHDAWRRAFTDLLDLEHPCRASA